MASKITDVRLEPLASSMYIRPVRMHFKQDGKQRSWDLLRVHDSVSIILYHEDRNSLLFVKQFRPLTTLFLPGILPGEGLSCHWHHMSAAVYLSHVPADENGSFDSVEWSEYPASLGYTLELCAGIVDKNKSLVEIAREEILEECGYSVPVAKLERVTTYKSGVGVTGALSTMFYAQIDDTMKISEGGGNVLEGENIDLVYIPVDDARRLLYDETVQRPSGVLFSLLWFFENKYYPPLAKRCMDYFRRVLRVVADMIL